MAVGPITPDHALLALDHSQRVLQTAFTRQTSGKRLRSPADGPAQYAIASTLQAQVASFEAASQNVQTALNATNVAGAALQSTSTILSQLRTLAVAAVNDFLAPTDRAALQAQADQLVAQANSAAQTTNFNGAPLLNGAFAGPNAGAPAQAAVAANPALAGGGTLVARVSAASANFQNPSGPAQGFGGTGTQDATISIAIVAANNGQAAAHVTAVDSATGAQVALPGLFASGATVSGLENVNLKLGKFSNADIGQTATVQIAQAVAPNGQTSALQVQSGAAAGATTGIAFGSVSAAALRIAHIDLSSAANATNSIGQLDRGIGQVGSAQSTLGAQQVQLQYQLASNDAAANALTGAQSQLADADPGAEASSATLASLQSQLGLAVLAQRNTQGASVLTLFGRGL